MSEDLKTGQPEPEAEEAKTEASEVVEVAAESVAADAAVAAVAAGEEAAAKGETEAVVVEESVTVVVEDAAGAVVETAKVEAVAVVEAGATSATVVETVETVEAAAPEVEREVRRGPSTYVESEGGRTSRIGSGVKVADVDYKNIALLSRFLDRRGRILSRRKTRVSAKVQRRVAVAIKRARHLALLPYTADQTRTVRKRR